MVSDPGVAADRTLEVGGVLIFVSGAAAALGALVAGRLGDVVRERRLLTVLLTLSAGFTASLGAVSSAWLYGVLRFLQVLGIAPVFPVTVARVALRAGGEAIGFINSARIGASFLGPVIATSMLASLPAPALYLLLAAMTASCVPLVGIRRGPLSRWRRGSP